MSELEKELRLRLMEYGILGQVEDTTYDGILNFLFHNELHGLSEKGSVACRCSNLLQIISLILGEVLSIDEKDCPLV